MLSRDWLPESIVLIARYEPIDAGRGATPKSRPNDVPGVRSTTVLIE
jgi:hypothetical protein